MSQETNPDRNTVLDLGKLVGAQQAFALTSSKCSAAQAILLRRVREEKLYRHLDLTWEPFCTQHVGLSPKTVDQIIARHDEFGESYFHFSELLHVTTPEYRALEPSIQANVLEFEGRRIPITRENSEELIRAVRKVRADLERARKQAARSPQAAIRARFDRLFGEIAGALQRGADDAQRQALLAELEHVVTRAWELQEKLAQPGQPSVVRPDAA